MQGPDDRTSISDSHPAFRKVPATRLTLSIVLGALVGASAAPPGGSSETVTNPTQASPAVPEPFPGKVSDWNGFVRHDFSVQGRPTLVVAPREPMRGRPWVWHGEFFGHKPAPDIALLQRGFHVVYTSIPDHFGDAIAVRHWDDVYRELTLRHGLGPKPALVGLSRGGLYCYNWASRNPSRVSCIYADAPVCDLRSWPGGLGKGKGSPRDWKLARDSFGLTTDQDVSQFRGSPVDQLEPLAAARVPLLHVFGDADDVVPWDENTGVIEQRYRALGGPIHLIRKPGVGHHPHGLDDPTPIVDFILTNGMASAASTGRP